MASVKITKSEIIDEIKKYKGKELEITVNISSTSWDYGDPVYNDYDVKYKIKLKNITARSISGTLCEEEIWDGRVRHEGELIVQPFTIESNTDVGWIGPSSKRVVLIKHFDEILYDKYEE